MLEHYGASAIHLFPFLYFMSHCLAFMSILPLFKSKSLMFLDLLTVCFYFDQQQSAMLGGMHGKDKASLMRRSVLMRKKPTRQGLRDSLFKSLEESGEINNCQKIFWL